MEKTQNRWLNRVGSAILAALLSCVVMCGMSFAGETETEKPEPEVNYEFDLQAIHVGQSRQWTPYADYPELEVTYSSSDPDILTIREDGTLEPHREGNALISAAAQETSVYREGSYEIYLYVLGAEDGLYLNDLTQHFYYQGKEYAPGQLPVETERKLCLTQPDLRVFLEDYLTPWQEKISDPDEAALTAILNFGAEYFGKEAVFDGYVSAAEAGKTDWMMLLQRKVGACAYHASLFCYLMHLSSLGCMQVDSPMTGERGHSWNLIAHDGYYYNLEEYYFLHAPLERFAAPPLCEEAAAYFPKHIIDEYYVHFPVEGGDFAPDTRVEDMGRDLAQACPVLMYEKEEDGTYRVWFDTVKKGHIPAYSDGTPLRLEDMRYRNMETDAESGEPNEDAVPLFEKADEMLHDEIRDLFNG